MMFGSDLRLEHRQKRAASSPALRGIARQAELENARLQA